MPVKNNPNRAIASSPGPASRVDASDQALEQVSVRPMRLKVLYTFDSENKTNHLARWPHPVDIQSAFLDENTQIGVVELKMCIQAIAAASPEVVAKLSHDFTVYAYDYSEYETPLVGQGMLSWILASSSATPAAPAHQSRTMVTGRVCKNVMGLFTTNSQETLEVKLRLVPVPTSLQSEYIESMKKYREVSQTMPPGFDPQVWTSFVQANPGFMQQALQSRSQSPAIGAGQQTVYGIEQVQRLVNGEGQQNSRESRRPISRANSFANFESTQQLPRMPSPALSVQSTASAPRKRGRPPAERKKPGPKGPRNRAASRKQDAAPQSNDTGYGSNDDGTIEDGPAKKRAKVMQAEWSSKQDFAKQPESLRVAASSAASVRIHQPTAMRLGANPAHSLEAPPREPTPIGNPMQKSKPPLAPARSGLRESPVPDKKVYVMPFPPPTSSKLPESAVTSPENSRIASSPPEMQSSPPAFGGSTAPCSPDLPSLSLPYFDDFGFMSGSIDDLFEDDDLRPVDEDFDILEQYITQPESPTLPPPKNDEHEKDEVSAGPASAMTPEEKAMEKSRRAARSAAGMTRSLNRTASSGPMPASDPLRPSGLSRSQTWSGEQAPHPASDIVPFTQFMDVGEKGGGSRTRRQSETGSGSGVKRKAAIQSKLATSIAAGEMPSFCDHCGSIETPTWRKAWVKVHSGTPEHVRISEEEGGILAWETLQTDHTGTVCLYRIIKKTLLKNDEGFAEILLCNPCGIYLHSRKCMRPRWAWDKSQKGPDDRGNRGPSAKRPRGGSMSSGTKSDKPRSKGDSSERSSSAGGQTEKTDTGPDVPAHKKSRASSEERALTEERRIPMDDASAAFALQKAIQASPHKFKGTQDIPIELNALTPQPTRRLLFPSPSKSQEPKSKQESVSGSVIPPYDASSEDQPQADKENCPPPTNGPDFSDSSGPNHNPTARPTTPTSLATSKDHLFKTPSRSPYRKDHPPTTGDFFSSTAKALLHPAATLTPKRTPTRNNHATRPLEELSPFANQFNQLYSDPNYTANDDNGGKHGSPASNKSISFPSLPSLQNSPNRPSGGATTTATSHIMDFNWAFDSQDLISTDVPMPSSPPVWFSVYEDDVDIELESNFWGDAAAADDDDDAALPLMTTDSASSTLKAASSEAAALTSPVRRRSSGESLFGDSPPKKPVEDEGPPSSPSSPSPKRKNLRREVQEEDGGKGEGEGEVMMAGVVI